MHAAACVRAYNAQLLARPGDYQSALEAAFLANRDAGGAATRGQHVRILQEAGLGRGVEHVGTEAGAIRGGGSGARKWWIPRL